MADEDSKEKENNKGASRRRFIKTAGAKDLYFHSSALQGVSFEALHEGQKVSYTTGQGKKGPCAENVKPI